MAFRYGSWSQPAGYDTSVNLVDEFKGGFGFGSGLRNEQDAKAALGDYVKSLYMGGQQQPVVQGSHAAAASATDPVLSTAMAAKFPGSTPDAMNDASRTAMQYFVSKGYSPAQAAGIVGNLMHESGLKTGALNPGDGADGSNSIGIAQWNGDRAKGLQSFAAQNGGDPNDLMTQLAYVEHELNGPEASTREALMQAQDPIAATKAFIGYERPQGWTAETPWTGLGFNDRAKYAAGLMGGADYSAQPPASSSPAPASASSGLPPRDVMMALFRNPETRGFAAELVKATKAGGSLINAGDGNIFDPKTGQWIKAPGATQKAPTVVELFDEQTGQPYKATWNPETGQFERQGGIKAPSGTSLTVGPDGTVQFQQGGGKPLTEGQSKDTVFSTRAEGALPLIDQFGDALLDPVQHAMGADPTGIVRGRQTPEFQQAWQAGREFLQAILRKDTGAAITPQETEEYGKVYLPSPGDTPEVLAQKKVSRARAVAAIEAGMPPQAILAKEKALLETGQPDGEIAEGTVIENDAGERMVLRGGQWEPM